MRIGVEASSLASPQTGIGEFTRLLVTGIAEQPDVQTVLSFVGTARDARALASYARRGHEVRVLRLPEALRRLRDWATWFAAGLNAGPVDVFWSPSFHLPLLTRARRLAVTVHDLSPLLHPEWFPRRVTSFVHKLRHAVARADMVLADTEAGRREIIDVLAVPAHRVTVVGSPFDPRFAMRPANLDEIRTRFRLPRRYVLSVGTLQPRKNFERLVAAFDQLDVDALDVDLVIVGNRGWLYESIFEAVSAARNAARIHVLSGVAANDLPALYHGADGFCMPSLYEGFGIPLLEAMASGVPVCASTDPAMVEVMDGAGLLFDARDVDGLASALRRLLTEEDLRRTLIERGQARTERFTPTVVAQRLLRALGA